MAQSITQAQFERALADALDREGFARMGDEDAQALTRADVQELLDVMSEQIASGLRRRGIHAVSVRGLGRFRIARRKARRARMGTNPATGEPMKIGAKPASKALKVTGDRWLRAELQVN